MLLVQYLSKLGLGFVKVMTWIYQICYMDLSKQNYEIVNACCYIDLLKLFHDFVKVDKCISRFSLNKTNLNIAQDV